MSAPKHRKAQPRHIFAAKAAELHAEGLNGTQIADRLQISKTHAYELLTDPTGEQSRVRKERYCGTCEECGARTSYTNDGSTPARCAECYDARFAERNERIFDAWDQGDTAPVIADREGMTPDAVTTLVDHYRRRYGMPLVLHRVQNRTHWPHIQRRWNEDGATLAELADELETTATNVGMMIRHMRDAGLDVHSRRSRGEVTERIAQMYNAGVSPGEIAAALEWKRTSIYVAISRLRKQGRVGDPREVLAAAA